jgi:hypothetical protein
METACSSKFYTWYFYITLVFIRINFEIWVTCWFSYYMYMYRYNANKRVTDQISNNSDYFGKD